MTAVAPPAPPARASGARTGDQGAAPAEDRAGRA